MAEMRFGQAIGAAIRDAMAADETVVLFGEDIAVPGGPFGVTRGLRDQFGEVRVRDTPISEGVISGAAVGAALSGLRPIVEIMFMDFTTLAMDALVNQGAKAHFMFGGQAPVPLVLRTQHGGGLNAGPQHSQCLEAWFAHIPGLKIVCPNNPADAYGLLSAAILDPNPVVFVENKTLYAMKGEVPDTSTPGELGVAQVIRDGRDATIVTYGSAAHTTLAAAEALAGEGVEVEVIDLRTLQPWDEAAVLQSLARTHRLIVVHEAVEAFGVGAEVAARMADIGFDHLDGPIARVGAPFTPVPFAPSLEKAYLPSADDVVAAVRRVME